MDRKVTKSRFINLIYPKDMPQEGKQVRLLLNYINPSIFSYHLEATLKNLG